MKIKLFVSGLNKTIILPGYFIPGSEGCFTCIGPKIVTIQYFYENLEETQTMLKEIPGLKLIKLNDKVAVLRIGEDLVENDTVIIRFV